MRRVLLLALVALVAGTWLLVGRDAQRDGPVGLRPDGTSAAPPGTQAHADVRDLRAEPERSPAPVDAPQSVQAPAPVVFVTERQRAALEIAVEDHLRAPVEHATVVLRSHEGPGPELYAVADERLVERQQSTDAHGCARFDDLPTGPYETLVTPPGGGMPTALLFLLEAPQGRFVVRFDASVLPAAFTVYVEDEQGRPVAGARVELTGGVGDSRAGRAVRTRAVSAVSDDRGRASVPDPGFRGFVVVATAPDGRVGTQTAWAQMVGFAKVRGLTVVVGAAARLEGTVHGLPPERLAGARVLARLLDNAHPHYTTHGIERASSVLDGHYLFAALPAGVYTLTLDDPAGARLDLPALTFGDALPNSVDPLEVELKHGATTVQDLEARAGGILAGRVHDAGGRPLAGAVVRATFAPRTTNFPDGFVLRGANVWRFDSTGGGEDEHPETHRRTLTAADGSYRLPGLHPGEHRVEVTSPGHTYDRREGVVLADGATTELEHVLAPAGRIAGVARDGSYLGVLRPGAEEVEQAAILPSDGLFSFPGLAAGEWVLARLHSDSSVAPVEVLTVTVEPGRTRWVDLDAEGHYPVRITGHVLAMGVAATGVQVRHSSRWVTTDDAGRFEFAAAFAPSYLNFTVAHADVVTQFLVTGFQPGEREWRGELVLGEHALELRTLDASGAASNALVDLDLRAIQQASIGGVRAEGIAMGPRGERRLTGLPLGEFSLTARFPDGSSVSAPATLPRADALVLRAPAAGTLAVRLIGPDGRPSTGATIQAWTWIGSGAAPADDEALRQESAWHSATTDTEGRAELRGVNAGLVLVEVRSSGFFLESREPSASERVLLAPGEHVEVTLRSQR